MKNMTNQITSMLLEFTDIIPHRFVLSGCPTPNHNSEIFPQMKFVDSDVLGNNYYGFLAKYFHQDMANPHYWYQTDEDKERYFARLGTKSVFLKKEDCVDLPDKVFEVRHFDLTKTQKEYKEELLSDVISEIGDKQIIIWCQFTHEAEKLAKKFGGIALTSKTKNRDNIIRSFKNGDIKLLFTHPQLLGKGLTFIKCSYNIYYSLSFSYEEFKQSQDRIHRIGQANKCTYIILQAKDTIEEKIYDCLTNKGNAVDELYLEMGRLSECLTK